MIKSWWPQKGTISSSMFSLGSNTLTYERAHPYWVILCAFNVA